MLLKQTITTLFVLFLLTSCASHAPRTFVETSNEAGAWKSIYLHDNYGFFANKNQEVWQRAIDVLSEKYDLEMLDRASGYIRTGWKSTLATGTDKYRHRIIIKMQGNFWQTAKLKAEAQWWNDSRQVWVEGYDAAILEEIYKELQGRLGTSL